MTNINVIVHRVTRVKIARLKKTSVKYSNNLANADLLVSLNIVPRATSACANQVTQENIVMSTSTIVFQTHVEMVDDVTMESILMNASVPMGGKERIVRLTLMSV